MNLSFIAITALTVSLTDTVSNVKMDTVMVEPIVPAKEEIVEVVPENQPEVIPEAPKPKELTHFLFKGIPIDGKPTDFGKKLEKNGFKPAVNGSYVGDFAGTKDCRIHLSSFDDKVWKVCVSFPSQKTWSEVKGRYNKYKNWLSWKYVVTPSFNLEYLSPRFKEGSGNEVWGFENGQSTYRTAYSFSDGQILVHIRYDSSNTGMFVSLEYIDRLNSILKEEKDMMDL